MPTETGIFTPEEAKTGHLFSYRLAEFIGQLLEKHITVYDFGCGPGTYVKYLQDIGFDAFGYEGSDIKFETKLIQRLELHKPLPKIGTGNVISIEVGEHIPKKFEQVFIDNICQNVISGGFLLLTWAHEGQQGYGHVNCRPDWYVIKQIEKRGFSHRPTLTVEARSRIEGHVGYLRENIFIFEKNI